MSLSAILRLLFIAVLTSIIALGQAPSTTILNSSVNPANYGQAVTLTATVNSGATGKVTFYDGPSVLGIGTISGTQANLTTVLLPTGTQPLRAHYSGDATFAPSNSAILSEAVVAGASLGFHHAVGYSSISYAQSIAVGDFNGDGLVDLAATTTSGVSVLIGKGDGTLQSAVNYSTGFTSRFVAVGDFNGDSKADLVVANQFGTNVSILLGNGDGTFQAAVSHAVGIDPDCIAVGDFNGDGKADLAVTNLSSANVSILLGKGDGTFQPAVSYTAGTSPAWVTLGDFNGDGKTDLTVVNVNSNNLSVLLGNGDGTFQAAVNYSVGSAPMSATVGDFNGDGKMDLAVATFNGSSPVGVLLGNGDGTFQAVVNYAPLSGSEVIITGDFNGDGKTDLAVANYYTSTVSVLLGNGDGTFQSPVNYTTNSQPYAIAAGDFNRDGKVDVVVGGIGSTEINVLLGGANPDLAITLMHDGGFTQGQQGAEYTITVNNAGEVASSGPVGVVATLAGAVTAVSIGGSGWTCTLATLTCVRSDSLAAGASYPTITIKLNVAGGYNGNLTSSATVSGGGDQNSANNTASDTTFVRLATTTGLAATPNPAVLGHPVTITATVTSGATGKITFYDATAVLGVATLAGGQAALTTSLLPSGTRSLHAEYDGDSTYGPSISATVTQAITASPANGLQPSSSYKVGTGPYAVAVGDFNRDGKPDLVTANSGGSNGTVSVLLGNGDGTFGTALTQAAGPSPTAVVVGDFNGDGYADVAISGINGVYVLLGNGDGTFQNVVTYGQFSGSYFSLAAADFDGDGKVDLTALSSGGIVVFLGNGDGTFQAPAAVNSNGAFFSFLVVADVNGDGKADLVAENSGYSIPASVLLGNGDGTFQSPVTSTVIDTYPMAFAMGDFNADGKPDIAVVYWTGIAVSLGNGDGTFHAPVKSNINFVPGYFAIAGDFNGDGKLDVACVGYYSNSVFIAFGNGDGTFSVGAAFSTDGYSGTIAPADFNGDGRPDFAISNNGPSTVNVFLGGQFSGLNLSVTHAGNFTAGQTGAYQIIVTNPAFAPATGSVTVTDTLPAGLTATAINGSGWSCTLNTLTCTRSDGLASSASYPAITVAVNVSNSLPASTINNRASVSNGGILNTATDPTVIVLPTTTTLAVAPNPSTLGQTVVMTATVTAGATGSVMFADGGTSLGTATLAAGQAAFSTPLLAAGLHSLRATYSGDATYAPSTSAAKSQTVNASVASGFGSAAAYATGAGPSAVVVGDFNRDGKPDLVTANSGGNSVSVLLGDGSGAFGAKADYAAGTQPVGVVVADFNNDGKSDLAVVNQGSSNISILLGNGDGTFQTATNHAAGNGPLSLAAGDFNGDGKVDLVVANGNDGTITLLLGNGDGSFHGPATIFIGGVSLLAIGDFNGDGKTDIAYGPYGVYVLLGNGNGTFQSALYNNANYVTGMVAGDLNGDGKTDIVTTDSNNGVDVMLGKGDGTFQPYTHYSSGNGALSVALADVNGDGKIDVIAANSGDNTISVLFGNGDGTLQPAISYAVGSQPRAVAVGTFNGDGRTDVAVANYQGNSVSVLLGVLTPVLSVMSAHRDSFAFGQTGAFYTITVTNGGPGVTSGTVTMTDTLPAGLTPSAIVGNGWSCTLISLTCTRSDSLAAATSYPAITLTVNVAANAPPQVTNQVTASGGGSPPASGNDPTTIGVLPTVNIDTPASSSVVTGTVTVAGWALDNASGLGTAISSVQVKVDGTLVGNATYGLSRPDVCNIFAGRPGCPNVGYSLSLNTAGLTPGPHVITVLATDSDVTPDTGYASVTVNVGIQPPTVWIDSPSNGSTVSGTITVNGWALDNTAMVGTAIGSVKVKVDTAAPVTAAYGVNRADVCGVWPGRPGCPNVGYSLAINTQTLSAGQHTITVTAVDSDGYTDVGSATVTVRVNNTTPTVWIDTPSGNSTVSGMVTVSGWAIDNAVVVGTALGSVKVLVDGTLVGNATYGTNRADVCGVWPGRPGCPNVGYTFALNTAGWSAGPHVITVSTTDSDGTGEVGLASVTVTTPVNATAPTVWIDTPATGATIGGAVTISGWALDNASAVGSAIGSVQVLVDGLVVGNATYGTNRADVCGVFPGRQGCPNVGYTFTWNSGTTTLGSHTITVKAVDSDGTPDAGVASATVTVNTAPATVWIDQPLAGATTNGTVTISGWAINNTSAVGTALGGVQVLVDGTVAGNATGTNRADVCGVWPGRPGCPNVGYTFTLNAGNMSPGQHVITVMALDSDQVPEPGAASVTVTVNNGPPLVWIDQPVAGATVAGTVTVSGWALDNGTVVGTAIGSVQVKVDGALIGTAAYGSNRADVCGVWPGRPGCPNVGYSFPWNTGALSAGVHILTVTATDANGNADVGNASVVVIK